MATDPALNKAHSESLEVWAPIHALRALGQLHDETAIEPLIPLLDEVDDDDALFEELPDVFAAFGPVAISALSAYLDNLTHTSFARVVTAGSALAQIVQKHPETRQMVVEQLTKELTRLDRNYAAINGFVVSDLVELHATE